MQTNQTRFARSRAALASALRSWKVRAEITQELNLLSYRALADLGLYRSDIRAFARDAARIDGAESVFSAIAADLKALLRLQRAVGAAGRAA